jgi:hypothetical protein
MEADSLDCPPTRELSGIGKVIDDVFGPKDPKPTSPADTTRKENFLERLFKRKKDR